MIKPYIHLIREIFMYGLIGLFSAFMDTISFLLLRKLGFFIFLSNFISVNIGICISFILNTYINFKKTTAIKKRAVCFFLIGYLGLALSTFIIRIEINHFYLSEIISKIMSVLIVAIIQYLANKFITFQEK